MSESSYRRAVEQQAAQAAAAKPLPNLRRRPPFYLRDVPFPTRASPPIAPTPNTAPDPALRKAKPQSASTL